jgi:hypothetical protein
MMKRSQREKYFHANVRYYLFRPRLFYKISNMNSKLLIIPFIVVVSCINMQPELPCPLCISIALHFAFVDSVYSNKVLMDTVTIINDNHDTVKLVRGDTQYSHMYITSDLNYCIEGNVGNYTMIVKDSIYGEFTLDSLIVVQNPVYSHCGAYPHTLFLKIAVKKTDIILGKTTSQGNYYILERFEKGSCG